MGDIHYRGRLKVIKRYGFSNIRGLEIDKMTPFSTLGILSVQKSGMQIPYTPPNAQP